MPLAAIGTPLWDTTLAGLALLLAGADAVRELACIKHPRLVNSAYFSPHSGRKLLTTCIDNRVRIWDNIHNVDRPATQEIVHSHDFNRHLTPFRAEWDPKDPLDRRVVIGR